MKKALLILPTLLLCTQAYSQSDRVTSAWNNLKYNEIKKAQENIDAAAKHESTKNEAKTWLYRGHVYYSIDTTSNPEFNKLSDNPKDVAIQSYAKCKKLDEAGRYENKMLNNVIATGVALYNAGAQDYNKAVKLANESSGEDTSSTISDKSKANFRKSLKHFENHFKSIELAGKYGSYVTKNLKKAGVDAKKPFLFAGYSAYQIGKYQKAKRYLRQLMKEDSDKAKAYLYLSETYLAEEDTAKALDVIDSGRKKLEGNKVLRNRMLRIYQQNGEEDKLIQNLEASIEENPDELQSYRVLAGTYEKLAKEARNNNNEEEAKSYNKKARKTYERLLDRYPYNFKANYNLGIMYYNIGVDKFKESQDVDDSEKIMALQDEGKKQFEKAIPFLEKAFYKNCGDDNLFKSLKNVYRRTNNKNKLNQVKDARQDNNQVTINVKGESGQKGTVTLKHSDKTTKFENISFSDEEGSYIGWDTDICPFGGKVEVMVEVTEGSKDITTKIYQMGEEQKSTDKKSFTYQVK